ncbi:unnamed protein product [Angiostrongylus costaricensis]|uniref:Nanos-type domain-containing protein n=1 Tax=Angiostrongylus costaricensis TaxID=334426 RepID=A0A0R3PUC4_ANGCS|nr:unnamed protein product [Angiostrongylus costaricensis]
MRRTSDGGAIPESNGLNEDSDAKFERKTQEDIELAFSKSDKDDEIGVAPPTPHNEKTEFRTLRIGELAEEFTSITLTPPNTPASAACVDQRFANTIYPLTTKQEEPTMKASPSSMFPWLSPAVRHSTLNASTDHLTMDFTQRNWLNSSAFVLPRNPTTSFLTSPKPNFNVNDNKPASQHQLSVHTAPQNTRNSQECPSRPVRRYEYWGRLLKARRRRPFCRFCYDRYVYMCLDLSRSIPSPKDRGIWHEHNMKERGCPHLYAYKCTHCGATKHSAHTDDYCPINRGCQGRNALNPDN